MNANGPQIKAGRLLLGWARMTLALNAHVSLAQIVCFETGKTLSLHLGVRLQRALEAAGVEFIGKTDVLIREAAE